MKCIHNILIIYPIFQRRLGNLIEDVSATNPIWQLALPYQFSMNRAEVRINIKKVSAHGDFLSDESFNYYLSNVNRIRYQRTILRYKSQIHMDSVARPV